MSKNGVIDYLQPATIDEASTILSSFGPDAVAIAGGVSVVLLLKQNLIAPKYLLDLKSVIELKEKAFRQQEDNSFSIPSLANIRALEVSREISQRYAALAEAASKIASIPIRNQATVGGNICWSDPAADLAPALIAHGAQLILRAKGRSRTMAVEDFFVNFFQTALDPGDILCEVRLPPPLKNSASAYLKLSATSVDRAIVGAAIQLAFDDGPGGICTFARAGLCGVSNIPLRARGAENALIGEKLNESVIEKACEAAAEETDPPSDMRGTGQYRKDMVKVMLRRAAKTAMARVKERLSTDED